MRRKGGSGLVRNELQMLAASLRLAIEGTEELHGYELIATLKGWDAATVMNPGTVYRCLRQLEARGLYDTQVWPSASGPPRVGYTLTLQVSRPPVRQRCSSSPGTPMPL